MTVRTVGSGKDHSTIQDAVDWFITNQSDFTGLGIQYIDVYNNLTLSANINLSGLTTTSSDYLMLRAFNDAELSLLETLTLNASGYRFNGLDGFVVKVITGFNGGATRAVGSDYGLKFHNCSLNNEVGASVNGIQGSSGAGATDLDNFLVIGFNGTNKYGVTAGDASIANMTVYDCTRGHANSSGGTVIDSVVLDSSALDFYGTPAGISYCGSSDTTAIGTGSLNNLVSTDEYTDPANGDFSLKVGNNIETASSTGGVIGYEAPSPMHPGVITSIGGDDSVYPGETGVAIVASGFDASPTTQIVTLSDGINTENLTITNWNSGQPIVTAPLDIDLLWGSTALELKITDDQGTAIFGSSVTLAVLAGWGIINFAGSIPDPNTTESFSEMALSDFGLTVAAGDKITLTTDFALSVDSQWIPTVNPSQTIVGNYKVWDDSDNTYTTIAEYTIQEGEEVSVSGVANIYAPYTKLHAHR